MRSHSSTASTLLEFYKRDIDGEKLVWQMNMLVDLVAEMRQTSLAFSSLKSVTNVRTLIDIVNTLPLTVGIFSGLPIPICRLCLSPLLVNPQSAEPFFFGKFLGQI